MMRAWVGVALLASAWLFGLHYYHAPVPGIWLVLIGLGSALLACRPSRDLRPRPGERAVAGIALILCLPAVVFVAPWPWWSSLALIPFGLALFALPVRPRWPAGLGYGLVSGGVILAAQSLVLFGYETLTARAPILPEGLCDFLAWLARLVNMEAVVDGPNLVLFSLRTKHPLAATWGLLVDPVSLCFLIGGILLILGRWRENEKAKSRWKAVAGFSVLMLAWMPVRTVLLMAVYLHRILNATNEAPLDQASQFWSPWIHVILLLPPVLLAWLVTRHTGPGRPPTPAPRRLALACPRRHVASGLVFLFAAVLTLAAVWQPSGPRKESRVLIDEYHCVVDDWSKWRWPFKDYDTTSTLRRFDTEWFGQASGYNYASIYEYSTRFFTMGRVTEPLSDKVLETCDVLLLKVPSRDFSAEEVAVVVRFVENGGGLLLMGEHTSVFGSGVHLNRIAREFGFEFRYDCLFGIESVFEEHYDPPPVPHPAIHYMGPLDFATACSIDPGLSRGRAVIRNTGLKNLNADYSTDNFYPQPYDGPEMLYGSFVQLWATEHGRGRVLAFADSTIFANFSIYEPGKSELFLGMLEWLNHRRGPSVMIWLALLALALAGGAGFAARAWGTDRIVLLGAALLGWTVAVGLARGLHTAEIPRLEPRHPVLRVAFERSLHRIGFPTGGFIGGKEDHYGIFERSVQRLTECWKSPAEPGRTWTTFRANSTAALDADVVVIILPEKPPGRRFLEALTHYVEQGGKLLVLDAPENEKSTANALLEAFEMTVARVETPESGGPLAGPPGWKWPAMEVPSTLEVKGGVPFGRVGNVTAAAWRRYGNGTVTVLGFGTRFSDSNMGVTDQEVPEEAILRVFRSEYALFRGIIEDQLPTQ